MRAVRVIVSGRVQGVGFRAFAAARARAAGLAGFVRNLPSGEVESEVAGAPDEIESYLADLRRGPPASAPTDLAITEIDASGVRTGPFSIL